MSDIYLMVPVGTAFTIGDVPVKTAGACTLATAARNKVMLEEALSAPLAQVHRVDELEQPSSQFVAIEEAPTSSMEYELDDSDDFDEDSAWMSDDVPVQVAVALRVINNFGYLKRLASGRLTDGGDPAEAWKLNGVDALDSMEALLYHTAIKKVVAWLNAGATPPK